VLSDVVLSDGEPRVTEADKNGAATLLNHSPRKRP